MKRALLLLIFLPLLCLVEQPTNSRSVVARTDWNYEVTANAGAHELSLEARFPAGAHRELSVNRGAEPYIRDVELAVGNGWQALPKQNDSWFLPDNHTGPVHIRYRFMLSDAARAIGNVDIAKADGQTLLSPPSSWLLRPMQGAARHNVIFHVTTPNGITFITGVFRAPGGLKDTYQAPASDLRDMTYAAFGSFSNHEIKFNTGVIDLAIANDKFPMPEEQIVKWATNAGTALVRYYNHFPIRRVAVIVRAQNGRGIDYGTTLGNGGATILMAVGRYTRQYEFDNDWMMTHELVHCMFPSVPRNHHAWVEEGLATYVEPIARTRAGIMSKEELWYEWVRDMPQGLPEYGDRGLDNTPTWGRTYWGGAIFYLLADVRIRERTHNRYGLEDALRTIAAEGGTVDVSWDLARVFDEGDKATGTAVLNELYDQMKATPMKVDLDSLWKQLGVERRGDTVVFNDQAPLASVRLSLTTGKMTR